MQAGAASPRTLFLRLLENVSKARYILTLKGSRDLLKFARTLHGRHVLFCFLHMFHVLLLSLSLSKALARARAPVPALSPYSLFAASRW